MDFPAALAALKDMKVVINSDLELRVTPVIRPDPVTGADALDLVDDYQTEFMFTPFQILSESWAIEEPTINENTD